MSEGKNSEGNQKITIRSEVHQRPIQEVEDAILRGVDESIDAFTGVPYVDGRIEAPVISKEQVISLREKIVNMDKDFRTLISGSNLSANELQLAKVIYIIIF